MKNVITHGGNVAGGVWSTDTMAAPQSVGAL